jgi:hypothetical protein
MMMCDVILSCQEGANHVHRTGDLDGHAARGDASDLRLQHGAVHDEVGR